MSEDDESTPMIFDSGEGIDLVFPLATGYSFRVSMTDDAAQKMIDIIQNKLNGRFHVNR